MKLEKPSLFATKREFIMALSLLIIVIIGRLLLLYQEYDEFRSKPFYYTTATVLKQYKKDRYYVLKLKTKDGYNIYTTSYMKRDISLYKIRIKILIDDKLTYWEYISSFYSQVVIKKIYTKTLDRRDYLLERIKSQHNNMEIVSFYSAIFLATPLDINLRKKISMLGVSHLVALSGFHLSILWGVLFGILNILYRPLQERYFNYRYNLLDLGVITILLLGVYLWFVEYPPSLVRSFVMLLSAWVLILLGIRLVTFQSLLTLTLLILAVNPHFIISVAFWFSILGVFYIYLILLWSEGNNKIVISMIYIPIGIYILMLPIIHILFGVTCFWQMMSPILSILFILLYPLSLFFHIINLGWIFDEVLLYLFTLPNGSGVDNFLPLDIALIYIFTSIIAIWSRAIFIFTLLLALSYASYLFWGIF